MGLFYPPSKGVQTRLQVHPQQQFVEARVGAEGVPASVGRHQAFEFLKPVEDDVDLDLNQLYAHRSVTHGFHSTDPVG